MSTEKTVDFLIIGSGAAGVCAALFAASQGKSVMLCEKAAKIGGTTALSNAMIWVPCSDHAKKAGIDDTLDNARRIRVPHVARMREERHRPVGRFRRLAK